MKEIDSKELTEIIESYGQTDLTFSKSLQVEPDTTLYTFYSNDNVPYVLIAADYLGGYEEYDLPHIFIFDYGPPTKMPSRIKI